MITDLFYPVRPGSWWNYNDLKYSLRSVDMHYHTDGHANYGQVFIVGTLPAFLDPDKVIHIPAKDASASAIRNVKAKLELVTRDERLSDNFLLMNDDMFFLRDCAELPTYHLGTLHHALAVSEAPGIGYWFKVTDATRDRLMKDFVGEPLNYEVHAPMMLNKELATNTLWAMPKDADLLFRSIYGNRYLVDGTLLHRDFKIHNEQMFQNNVYSEFASTSPTSIRLATVQAWLAELFPFPSRWELPAGKRGGKGG